MHSVNNTGAGAAKRRRRLAECKADSGRRRSAKGEPAGVNDVREGPRYKDVTPHIRFAHAAFAYASAKKMADRKPNRRLDRCA